MLSVLAAILMQAAAPASAPAAAPPRPSVIVNPDWLSKPTGQDMAKFYPKAATDAHIEGRVILRCNVTAAGDLADCTTSGEDPAGQGFANAALSLAPSFKMRPMTRDGVPVSGGKINIPIAFRLPRQTPPTLEVALECYGAAAAEAERNPTAEPIQAQVFLWRVVVEVLSVPEKLRPSALEGRLNSARKMGDTPEGAGAAHQRCEQLIPPAMAQSLTSQVRLPLMPTP